MPVARRRVYLGYITACLALVGYCTSTVTAQALQWNVPDFQLSFIRYTVQMFLSIVALRLTKSKVDLSYDSVDKVIGVAVSSLLFNILFYHASAILPLVDSYASLMLLVILMLALLTKFYQQIDLGLFHHIAILSTAFGCFLIFQPWKDFQDGFIPPFMNKAFNISELIESENATISLEDHLFRGINIWEIFIQGYILVALAAASEAIFMMIVGQAAIDPFVLTAAVSPVCVLSSLLMIFYFETPVLITDPKILALVLTHGAGVGMGTIFANYACTCIAPSRVSVVISFNIIILLVVQYTVMRNGLFGRMNILEAIGCVVITLSIILSSVPTLFQKQHVDLVY